MHLSPFPTWMPRNTPGTGPHASQSGAENGRDVTGHRDLSNQGAAAESSTHSPSLTVRLSLTASPPSFPPLTASRMSLLRHGVAARSDWSLPSSHTPLPAIHLLSIRHQAQSAAGLAGDRTQIPTRLALNNYASFTMTSHITCTKGVTALLYGGMYNQYGGFVRPWLFDDYHFWCCNFLLP